MQDTSGCLVYKCCVEVTYVTQVHLRVEESWRLVGLAKVTVDFVDRYRVGGDVALQTELLGYDWEVDMVAEFRGKRLVVEGGFMGSALGVWRAVGIDVFVPRRPAVAIIRSFATRESVSLTHSGYLYCTRRVSMRIPADFHQSSRSIFCLST